MTSGPPTDAGPRQRVVLHVGLPKTGTTWLQGLLAGSRDRLRAGGVLYPFLRPGAMFHGAVEVRGSAAKFGLRPEEVAGTWAALCERARRHPGTTVLSHEVLGGAAPEQVARALAPLAGLEVHVVVTARDLARQATAHWQEEVKLGDPRSFADLEREELRADTGRDAGPDSGGVRPRFWHAQDFADALRRWSAQVPAERCHLVVCPPEGAPRDLLWHRFAEAAGLDPALVDPAAAAPPANPSLGVPAIALLREVNAALGDRLGPRERNRLVKREYAEGVLAALPGRRPRTPADLVARFEPVTRAWLAEVAAAGHPVHGDPEELVPRPGPVADPHPDTLLPGERLPEDPRALAESFVTRAARGSLEEAPDRRPEADGPGAEPSGGWRARIRGRWSRVPRR